MHKLVIEGPVSLKGRVAISGAKNAALPILFASILLDEPVVYLNVPDLRDIYTTVGLLNILGCQCSFANGRVEVVPGRLSPEAPYDLVKTMRASILCLGPLLARLGVARVALPGGCAIGARPVNLHLCALERMGARFELKDGYVNGSCRGRLKGARIIFDFPTVGGTENLLMAAALAEGETILENAAREPEVVDLARFLTACGAQIAGAGTSVIHIQGVERLHGCTYSIMPDRIEAGTFMLAAAITDGDLVLENCPLTEMEAVIAKFLDMGLEVSAQPDGVRARMKGELRGVDITTQPHPGFPTDLQAQVMAVLCVAHGSSTIRETIFENRFMHVQELTRLGAEIRLSGNTAVIRGAGAFRGAPVMASDLRASASLVLAALAAEGVTEIERIYHLDRGYERIEDKLRPLGARIRRVRT